MNINKENYEAYFLDYFEGNLSPEEISELLHFIENNPEIRNEFESYEAIALLPDHEVSFTAKESLKKDSVSYPVTINENNIDEFLCAELEQTLSSEESSSLNIFLESHPSYKKDRALFAYTKLEAETSIIYPDKDKLYHKAIPVGNIDETNYEHIMVQFVEGTLDEETQKNLHAFLISNPQLKNDLDLYKLTLLEPDKSIVFENKASLKHTIVPFRRIVYYSLSAAASLALLFSLFTFWDQNKPSLDLAGNQAKQQVNSVINNNKATIADNNSPSSANNSLPVVSDRPTDPVQRSSDIGNANAVKPVVEESRADGMVLAMTPLAYREVNSNAHVDPEFMFIRTSQMHSNQYLELYYNIKLAEQIQYAEINAKDANPEKTLFNTFGSKVTDFFAFNKKNEVEEKPGVSVWTFAELGVKTYNNITRDNVKLDLNRDEKGNVVSYNLSGDKLDFQRDIRK